MLSHSETIVDLKLVFLNQQSFSNFPVKYWKNKIHLSTRVKQHRSENAVGQHLQTYHTCDHNFNKNQFQILSTGDLDFDCKIRCFVD